MDNIELNGKILKLSLKSCELALEESLAQMTDINMNLLGVKDNLSIKDFYAKVRKNICSDPRICYIRFTSLPQAINGYFQAILNRDTEIESK